MLCRTLVALAMVVGSGAVSDYAEDGNCNPDNCQEDSQQSVGISLIQQKATITSTATCECVTPNAGASGHNQYSCSDGYTAWCASNEACYNSQPFLKGSWSDGCAVTCTCVTPNAGTAGNNQYTCTDGDSAWCSSAETCYATDPFVKGQWTDGCVSARRRRYVSSSSGTDFLLTQMIPDNTVAQWDAPVVRKDVRLSALVTMHDAADAKTMQRAESLKYVLGADFKGKINEVLLESSPALQSMVSNRPIKVVDRGDGRHIVADGNGRIQAMKLAFVDHSVVNVAVDEVELGHKEKKEFLQRVPMLRAAADDQAIRKGLAT